MNSCVGPEGNGVWAERATQCSSMGALSCTDPPKAWNHWLGADDRLQLVDPDPNLATQDQ